MSDPFCAGSNTLLLPPPPLKFGWEQRMGPEFNTGDGRLGLRPSLQQRLPGAEKRKKTDKPKRGMREEDRVHTCTSRILEEVGLSCSQARKKKERITAPQAKKRKKRDNPREGWEDGTPPPREAQLG